MERKDRGMINIVISLLAALGMPGSMITEVHLSHLYSLHILIPIFFFFLDVWICLGLHKVVHR